MKKIYRIVFTMVFASIVLNSCEKVENINNVSFDPTFTAILECSVPANVPNNPTYGASATINPREDPKVNLYLNSIKGYEITSATATITSLSQNNVTIVSGTLIIKNFQYEILWNLKNELLTVGKTTTLGNENGELDTLSKILKDGQEVGVLSTGSTDFSGITFTIKIEIKTKATAKII